MRHLLVTFVNKDPHSACIINSYESQSAAERAANVYLDDHPEDAAHVYSWSSGYTAEQRVSITKEWAPPEQPPTPELDPPIIVEDIELEDKSLPTIEEVREQL